MTLSPILLFIFFQWTLRDSWVPILLSVLVFIAALGGIGFAVFVAMREARRSDPYSLFSRPELLSAYGPLYAQYLNPRYFYFLIPLAAMLFRAIFISFGHASGLAQIILLMIVELTVLVSVLVLRPHTTRGADVFSSFLAIIRLVCTGLLIAFLQSLNVQPIPRVAIGIVMAVIFSVTFVVVLINLILHSGINRLWSRRKDSPEPTLQGSSSGEHDMLEKKGNTAFSDTGKSANPTSERRVSLDPEVNQSSPLATPTTANDTARDSTSTNLGNLLPRRWSFTPLSSPALSTPHSSSPPPPHPTSTSPTDNAFR